MGEYKRGFMLMTRLSKIPANAPIHKRQYKRPCFVMRLLRHLSQLGRIIPGVETQIRITPCHATGVCTERVFGQDRRHVVQCRHMESFARCAAVRSVWC
jgi:hypothetical protein